MDGFGGNEPRIDPRSLNLDRSLRRSRRMYCVEERDGAGRWIEQARFGSYEEASTAFDRLSARTAADRRLRRLDPRRRLKVAASIVGAIVLLAVAAWWVAYLFAG